MTGTELDCESTAVVYWVESTHTLSHLERFAEISQEVGSLGVAQVLFSGATGLRQAEESSGSFEEFGFFRDVDIVPLPVSRPQSENGGQDLPFDSSYALWQYMKDPVIVNSRRATITDSLQSLRDRGFDISHVIPEMYPVGMCILGPEVEFLHDQTKEMFPGAMVMPLARDIPAIMPGSPFNDPREQLERMRRYTDAMFIRGDDGVLESYYQEYGIDDSITKKLRHVGHFIGATVVERNVTIVDSERKVLVSAGGSSSDAPRDENDYYAFYRSVLNAKSHTKLSDRDWVMCIPADFPSAMRAEICTLADEVGGVEVRDNLPLSQHRQAIADSELFITVTGYSSMLAGMKSGVPTVVVPAQIQKTGVQQDVIDRSRRYHDEGLVTQIEVSQLDNTEQVARLIDERLTAGPAQQDKIPPTDGAKKLAGYIENDLAQNF